MTSTVSPIRALAQGLADVLKAPLMLIAIAIATILVALPFAALLNFELQESLSVQPQVNLADTEIDPEWWMEFREHATGLAATFTPAVLGFAATLDGLSHVMDGRRPPTAILLPLFLSIVVWAFLWGGVLERFQQRRGVGVGGFLRAGARHLVPFIAIAAGAAIVNLILYLTLHKLLFGPVHRALVAMVSTERDAVLIRVFLYLIFFAFVVLVSMIADYARVSAVAAPSRSLAGAVGRSTAFIRSHFGAVITLYLITGAIFVVITIAYGVLEVYGGSQVGGWRAVAIGQAYVFARLGIRLAFASSELRLFNPSHTADAV
jgi:hypothetical protein